MEQIADQDEQDVRRAFAYGRSFIHVCEPQTIAQSLPSAGVKMW